MENNIINILKEHKGEWIVIVNHYDKITRIQRIDDVYLNNKDIFDYIRINGPMISFNSVDAIIRSNFKDYEYTEKELNNFDFIKEEDFEKEIGRIIYKYINE